MTTLQDIPLRLIRLQGTGWDKYVFNTAPRVDELAESIGRIGLNNPLTLVESDGSYLIICGYARALALQRINWWSVPCFVADAGELGDEQLLRINIEDNRFSREHHYLDVARILIAFRQRCGCDDDMLARDVAPLLGIQSGTRLIRRYLALNSLPESVRGILVRETLSFAHAVLLCSLPAEDAEAIAIQFARTGANANEAKEIAEGLTYLARARHEPVRRLLASNELKGLSKKDLREAIFKMRYPTVAAAEEEFDSLVAGLHLDTNAKVAHSPNFEGDSLRISITVRSPEDLSSALKKLQNGLKEGTIGKILEIPRRPADPERQEKG